MEDTKLRFGVGVLVLSAIGVGVILTFLFGAFPAVLARTYTLTIDMDSAAGVSQNTPVLRDGVRIGRVTNIELKPEGGVRLTLAIDAERQLTRNYVPRTVTGSLITGDAKLEFQKDNTAALINLDGQAPVGTAAIPKNNRWDPPEETLANTYYSDGDYILSNDRPVEDPLTIIAKLENEVRTTLDAIRTASLGVNDAASKLTGVVTTNESSIRDIMTKTSLSLDQFQLAVRDVQSIVSDPELKASLKQSLEALPRVLDETEDTIVQAKETIERVGNSTERTMDAASQTFQSLDRTIVNIEKFTEPLGERGDEIVAQVLVSMRNLDRALAEIATFGEMVNNSDGTLRKIIEDDEMYYQIKRTIGNIETASARIRPIMDDVRVFTDKLARDPRELGVRGALSQRPSGLGLK